MLAAAASLAFAGQAMAAPGTGESQGSGGSEGDRIVAVASYSTGGGEPFSSGDSCGWFLIDGGGPTYESGVALWWPWMDAASLLHHLWKRDCAGVLDFFDIATVTAQDLLPGLLEELQTRVLPKPVPKFEMLDAEFGWAYVRVPLDFRAAENSWRPVSVSATAGPLSVTVTGRPTLLSFSSGDQKRPESVSCTGLAPVAAYMAAVPGECSYTYMNASSTSLFDHYHFQTSLSTTWEISWTSSSGAGGGLPSFTTSSSVLLAVAEVKGLVTCTGPRPEQGGC